MCCRVNKFLCCLPLEGFGLFIGWFNLIITIVAACFLALFGVLSLVTAQIGLALLIVILFGLVITLIYYTKEFIEGISEHNHERMRGYRLICVLGLAFSIISASVLITSTLFMRRQSAHHEYDVSVASTRYEYQLTPMQALVKGIVSIIMEIYIFICINSLYLEIKEQGPYTRTQIPTHNVLINHHLQQQQQYQQQRHQPVMAVNLDSQPPPSYNAAMQQMQGYPTQVVIPMHTMNSEVSSFKPQAV